MCPFGTRLALASTSTHRSTRIRISLQSTSPKRADRECADDSARPERLPWPVQRTALLHRHIGPHSKDPGDICGGQRAIRRDCQHGNERLDRELLSEVRRFASHRQQPDDRGIVNQLDQFGGCLAPLYIRVDANHVVATGAKSSTPVSPHPARRCRSSGLDRWRREFQALHSARRFHRRWRTLSPSCSGDR